VHLYFGQLGRCGTLTPVILLVVLPHLGCGDSKTKDLHTRGGTCADANFAVSPDGAIAGLGAPDEGGPELDGPGAGAEVAGPVDGSVFSPASLDAARATDVQAPAPIVIFDGTALSSGFGMGVDTSEKQRSWVSVQDGTMTMAYPSGQSWGAVFVSVFGDPVDPPRPKLDIVGYGTLRLEMKGGQDGDAIDIGLKDNLDPDNGTESKISTVLTTAWKTYDYALKKFATADLKSIYIITEIVFSGSSPVTVGLKSIQLLP
jgi:hypothetical protein